MNDKTFNNELREADRIVKQVITGVDENRAASFQHLTVVWQTKSAQWERERARLSTLLGENHPVVDELAQRIENNRRMLKSLEIAADQAKTEVPEVDSASWAIHGRVRDPELKSQAGLTVALYDESKRWIRQSGYGHTDQTGYFLIHYKAGPATDREPKSSSAKVYIHVLDAKGNTIYIDRESFAPEPGRTYYREIVLSREGIGQPPPSDEEQPPKPREPKRKETVSKAKPKS